MLNFFLYLGIAIFIIFIILSTCLNSCLISFSVVSAFMFLLVTSFTEKLQFYLGNNFIHIAFKYTSTLLPYKINSPSIFFNVVIVAATLCSSLVLSAVTFLLLQTFTSSHLFILTHLR